MRYRHLTFCFLLFSLTTSAQKEASFWYFGYRAGLDFSSGNPVPLTNGYLFTEEGCASISDANGRLLFYTDGRSVLNRRNLNMPNGFGLNGNISSTQSAVVVKSPGSDSIYYIFTIGAERQDVGLCYSVVNMKRDGGYGDVVTKNVNLFKPAFEKIGAVNHCNNKDVWVVTRKWDSDEYHAFLVTKDGVQTTPVISSTGLRVGGSTFNSIGVLRFSNDGRRLAALHSYGNDLVELLDFDSKTGKLTNMRTLKATNSPHIETVTGVYGAEFSNNSKLLYVTWYNTLSGTGSISQFDVSLGSELSIQNSKQTIADLNSLPAAAQMGPDYKIYVSFWNDNFISVINNPNNPGVACNFVFRAIQLGEPGKNYALGGLPSFLQSYFSPEAYAFDFKRSGECASGLVDFRINKTLGADSVRWNFGDPVSLQNTSVQYNPTHEYSKPGVYPVSLIVFKSDCTGLNDTIQKSIWIKDMAENMLGPDRAICRGDALTVSVPVTDVNYLWSDGSLGPNLTITASGEYWLEIEQQGCTHRDTINVTYKDRPIVDLGKDTALCAGQSLLVDAGNAGASYLWDNGSTLQTYLADRPGNYWVRVTRDGCPAADTLKILSGSCQAFVPNAFTPNRDGLNDYFGMINTGTVKDFRMEIFDRWGQRVYSTTDKDAKWDGTFKGIEAAPATYIWVIQYNTNTEPETRRIKGTVVLIR